MWRPFVSRITRLATLTNRPDPINKRSTKLFQLHQFGLLAGDDIVEFVQQLVLMSKS